MRRLTIACLLLVFTFSFALAQDPTPADQTPGDAEKTVELPPFTKILLAGYYNVVITANQRGHSCRFVADSRDLPFLTAEVKDGALTLGESAHLWLDQRKAVVYVSAANIEDITVFGGGDVKLSEKKDGPLSLTLAGDADIQVFGHADALNIEITGRGSVRAEGLSAGATNVSIMGRGDVELADITQSLNLEVMGAGQIDAEQLNVKTLNVTLRASVNALLTGTAEQADINVTAAGILRAADLKVKRAKVVVMGTGTVQLGVTEALQAVVYGHGDITYFGNPTELKTKVFGSGRIRRGEVVTQ